MRRDSEPIRLTLSSYEAHSHGLLTSLLVPRSVYSVCWLSVTRKFREHLSFDLLRVFDSAALFQYSLCPPVRLDPQVLPLRAGNTDLLSWMCLCTVKENEEELCIRSICFEMRGGGIIFPGASSDSGNVLFPSVGKN